MSEVLSFNPAPIDHQRRALEARQKVNELAAKIEALTIEPLGVVQLDEVDSLALGIMVTARRLRQEQLLANAQTSARLVGMDRGEHVSPLRRLGESVH